MSFSCYLYSHFTRIQIILATPCSQSIFLHPKLYLIQQQLHVLDSQKMCLYQTMAEQVPTTIITKGKTTYLYMTLMVTILS